MFSFYLDLKYFQWYCQWSVWSLKNDLLHASVEEYFMLLKFSSAFTTWLQGCGGLTLSSSFHTAAHSSLPQQDGEGNQKSKWGKNLMGWDKDSLTGKAKAAWATKTKERIHSLVAISRQLFSHLQESRASSHITLTWENKGHNSIYHPLLPSFPRFIAEHNITGYAISLWSVGVPCPSLLPTPTYSLRGAEWEKGGTKDNLNGFSWEGQCEKQKRPRYCASTAQR